MIKFKVDTKDINSIKDTLLEYKKVWISGKAIKNSPFGEKLNVLFLDKEGNELNSNGVEGVEVLKAFEAYWSFSFGGINTEDSFFAHALSYPSLKEDILEVLLVIIDYARKENDTSELWADDDNNLIGLGSIVAFTKLYPEYLYLLGLYLIPYWDDEHAPFALDLFENLVNEREIDKNTLKLFCYTDNARLRNCIFEDMRDFFRENLELYQWFKEVLKERFLKYPFIPYTTDEKITNPLDNFYYDLMNNKSNWALEPIEKNLSEFFIYDKGYIESETLFNEIKSISPLPLVQKKLESKKENRYKNPLLTWKNFIENEFRLGREIWSYIYSGGDRNTLLYLNGLYDDFYDIIAYSDYDVKKFLPSWASDNDSLFEVLDQLTERTFEYFNNTFHNVSNEMILNFTDFLYEIFSRKTFHRNFVNLLVEEYEVCSLEEFYIRYPLSFKERKTMAFENFLKNTNIYKKDLEEIKNLFLIDDYREDFITNIFDKNKDNSKVLLLSSYFLSNIDNEKESLKLYLEKILSENLISLFWTGFDRSLGRNYNKDSYELLKKTYTNRDIESLKKVLEYDNDYEFDGLSTSLLSSRNKSLYILQSLYLILKNNLIEDENLKKIFYFILGINPVEGLIKINKINKDDFINKYTYKEDTDIKEFIKEFNNYLFNLESIGLDKNYILAYEAYFYEDNYLDEEKEGLLNILSNHEDLEGILNLLYEELRYKYAKVLKDKYNIDFFNDMTNKRLYKIFENNFEKEVEDKSFKDKILKDIIAYINGHKSFEEIEKYKSYINNKYFYIDFSYRYNFIDTFDMLDKDSKKRFFIVATINNFNIYENIFDSSYGTNKFEETYSILKELNLPIIPLMHILIENNDTESLIIMDKIDSLKKYIHNLDENNKVLLIKLIKTDRYLRRYLIEFQNDSSEIIRGLIQRI